MTWIRHQRAKRKLDRFVDDELAMAPRGRVQDHLDECPDCAAHVRMLLAVRRSLRRATGADPEALRRLQARLADIEPEA